eukprot:5546720-Pyramimonas_sp.AAC.1
MSYLHTLAGIADYGSRLVNNSRSRDNWNKDLAPLPSALSKMTPSAFARACAACVFVSVARAKTSASSRSVSSAWSS